jgi:Fe-S cluster assembly protein SufD
VMQPTSNLSKDRVMALSQRYREPAWLSGWRIACWDAYAEHPMPSQRDEGWRRIEISHLDLSSLQAADYKEVQGKPGTHEVPPWIALAREHIGKVAGCFYQSTQAPGAAWLDGTLAARGVVFCDLATAVRDHEALVRPYLEKESAGQDKFALLAGALFNAGAFLYVPPGLEIAEPFVFGVAYPGAEGGTVFPRVIVAAGERSAVTLAYLTGPVAGGADEPASLLSGLCAVHAGAQSRVCLLRVLELPGHAFLTEQAKNYMAAGSELTSLVVALGGSQVKCDLLTYLQGRGASSKVAGAVLGGGHENFSFDTSQEHNAPDTTSNINFRVALADAATSVYQGTIRVDKVAQRTDAYQSNKNLLLGRESRADSMPKLEILADDVKCSHGATVGPLDAEQVFYLMSRGLSAAEARELIVMGFFTQVLDVLPGVALVGWLRDVLGRKMLGSAWRFEPSADKEAASGATAEDREAVVHG